MNRCQKQSWTCSDSALMRSGNPGRSRTPLYHLFSVRSHYSTSTSGVLEFAAFYVADSSAFLILFIRARRDLPPRSSGVTSLWRVILRDATLYFVVIFCIQFSTLVVPLVTTVCGVWGVRRCCAHRDYIFSGQSRSCPQCKLPFLDIDPPSG